MEHRLFDGEERTGIHVARSHVGGPEWCWFVRGDWTGTLYPSLDEVQKVAADYYLKMKGPQADGLWCSVCGVPVTDGLPCMAPNNNPPGLGGV